MNEKKSIVSAEEPQPGLVVITTLYVGAPGEIVIAPGSGHIPSMEIWSGRVLHSENDLIDH